MFVPNQSEDDGCELTCELGCQIAHEHGQGQHMKENLSLALALARENLVCHERGAMSSAEKDR